MWRLLVVIILLGVVVCEGVWVYIAHMYVAVEATTNC